MMDKVSIIIPVYNTEKYIEKCIQSVCNQTYQNLEIICVDDGSTDDSGKILDRFAQADKRIKVIHKENEGVSAARNDGLRIATGEWIGFVDSDDYIAEDMYEIMMKANVNQEADIVSCGYYFDNNGKCLSAENKKKVPDRIISTREFLLYIYERDIYKAVGGYLWSRLFRKALIKDDTGRLKNEFPEEYGVGEDIIFLSQVLMNSQKSLYVEKSLYYYVQRGNSAVHDERKQLETLSWAKAYLYVLDLYKKERVSEYVYQIIARMYVYRCGRLAEVAIQYNLKDKYSKLKNMISDYKEIYEKTNLENPERIKWINSILDYEWKE